MTTWSSTHWLNAVTNAVCCVPTAVRSTADVSSCDRPCAHFSGVAGSLVVPTIRIGGVPSTWIGASFATGGTGQYAQMSPALRSATPTRGAAALN